jgi:hypothetical protein
MRSEITTLALAGLMLAAPLSVATSQQKPFTGFNPGRCAVAARVIDGLVRRPAPDTAVYAPGTDTLFTVTKDSIEACQATFGGRTDAASERLNLARVELVTRQDSAALATARRHLGTMTKRTPEERGWELYLVATDNLAGQPARIGPARDALAELDRLGKPAATVRVLAHYAMASAAWVRYDDPTVIGETSAAIAAWKELDQETRLWRGDALASVFLTRAHLAALTAGGDAARAVIDTARGVIPPAARNARLMIESAGRMYGNLDKSAAPLEAAFWFNTGADGKDRPGPRKVSIILPAYRPCTGGCPSLMRAMKRFAKRFRDRGLQITYHTQTYGYYVDTAPASPYDEARYDSTYFLGELNIPGALAIAETEYSWKPDGRRQNAPTTNQQNYPSTAIAFVDRRGIIRYVAAGWQRSLEERYAELIERLLAEQASTP